MCCRAFDPLRGQSKIDSLSPQMRRYLPPLSTKTLGAFAATVHPTLYSTHQSSSVRMRHASEIP